MVNNINPTTSKLLEEIKRLSAQTTKKQGNHIDFKDSVLNDHPRTIKESKRTNLMNSIERIQRKNNIPTKTPEVFEQKIFTKNVQASEWTKVAAAPKNNRAEAVGSSLDIYL